jgi:soluble lytic murein transglycosylase-like protein
MRLRLHLRSSLSLVVGGFCWSVGFLLAYALLLLVADLMGWNPVHAQEIPRAAQQYRSELIRCGRAEWGLSAPTATFAAQIHQESLWNANARSRVGAGGLGQFMPSTAGWFGEIRPDLGAANPYNPGWALRALAGYDRWLWQRIDAADDCNRMAMTLSAYNGGFGWLSRDKRTAASVGLDQRYWWGQVELVNAGRAAWAWNENRGYPCRILHVLEPLYEAAGWGRGVCP